MYVLGLYLRVSRYARTSPTPDRRERVGVLDHLSPAPPLKVGEYPTLSLPISLNFSPLAQS